MAWPALAAIAGQVTGNLWSNSKDRKAQKREYKYNSWLQEDNQAWQEYMAKNAHQMEMEDLEKAGLNPALTAHQSSAGAIAGSSAAQGTSDADAPSLDVASIVDNINKLRQTNANIINEGKQADAAVTQAEAANKNADANMLNARTNAQTASTGFTGRYLGNKFGIVEGLKGWDEVAKRADKKLNNWIDKSGGKIRTNAQGKGYYSKSMLLGK